MANVTTDLVNYAGPARSAYSYGVCFRCHSGYATLGGRPDAALQFNSLNPSVHAIEGPSTSSIDATTFVSPWNKDTVLYCSDCHDDAGRSGSQARGLHTSSAAPILGTAYLGRSPDDATTLCYGCHKWSVYAGAGTGGGFETSGTPHHGQHVAAPAAGRGFGCGTCHVSHGSTTQPHLLRDEVGFVSTGLHAGECTNACHSSVGGTHAYGP